MATFHLDLVSPEKLLFAGEVDQVDVPGSEGDFGVLAGHAPLIATLRPGILAIYREGSVTRIVVNGGFAEVSPAGLTVLADMAAPVETFNASAIADEIRNAEAAAAAAQDGARRDKLAHRVDQLKALQVELAR